MSCSTRIRQTSSMCVFLRLLGHNKQMSNYDLHIYFPLSALRSSAQQTSRPFWPVKSSFCQLTSQLAIKQRICQWYSDQLALELLIAMLLANSKPQDWCVVVIIHKIFEAIFRAGSIQHRSKLVCPSPLDLITIQPTVGVGTAVFWGWLFHCCKNLEKQAAIWF